MSSFLPPQMSRLPNRPRRPPCSSSLSNCPPPPASAPPVADDLSPMLGHRKVVSENNESLEQRIEFGPSGSSPATDQDPQTQLGDGLEAHTKGPPCHIRFVKFGACI